MLLCAALAVSCIYDFEAELGDGGKPVMVIEGDIIVGGYTEIKCSFTRPVGSSASMQTRPIATAYVQAESGEKYESPFFDDSHVIDTRDASPDKRYKLVVTSRNDGATYETDWLDVHKAPVIDELSSRQNVEQDRLDIGITAHSAEGESYFKWRYEETWEYHSLYYAYLKYIKPNQEFPTGQVVDFDFATETNFYYCWRNAKSTDVRLFSTDKLSDDRFVDLEFHSVRRNDDRLSTLYHLNVFIEAISEQAYRYWEAVASYSNNPGDFFSPMPSEIVGNIRCTSDPDAKVVGYISASTVNSLDKYFDESKFYRPIYEMPEKEPDVYNPSSWPSLYRSGYLPIFYPDDNDPGAGPLWTEARCVDCTLKGGTKVKPADWPNNHK